MNTNMTMLFIVVVSLIVSAMVSWGLGYLKNKGKDPTAFLDKADSIITEAQTINATAAKFLPVPTESIISKILQVAQAGVHAAQQLCNSGQLTDDQRKQKAFDSAMNLLKLEGYEPTPELETAVKDMIETGVFILKNTDKVPDTSATPTTSGQAVHQAITDAVTQVVTPIANQAANDAVQQAINQTAQAFQGVVAPKVFTDTQPSTETCGSVTTPVA